MVHIKAFQTGYLTFDKKFVNIPGYVYGSSKYLHTYSDVSSFLPFTAVNRESYGPGQNFQDMRRPYREGFVQRPVDDGSLYASKVEGLTSSLENYMSTHTEPLSIPTIDLTQKPVAVIYNPTSGKKRNIRA